MTTTTRHSRRIGLRRPRDHQHHHQQPIGSSRIAVNSIPCSITCPTSKLSSSAWLLLLLALSNTITQSSASYQYQNPYADNNGYNGRYSSSYSSGGGGVAYSYGGGSSKMPMKMCQDSVVQVTKVEWTCDSPYTWYYGSGAHRNSATCDYGDKMTMTVKFQVVATIEEVNDIYTTMAIYDDSENLLSYTNPDYLCKNYVNSQCTYAGTYSFTTKLTLTRPNSNGEDEVSYGDTSSSSSGGYYHTGKVNNFYPVLHMAFSTKQDSGYNLGALNVACKEWNEQYPSYVAWSNQTNKTRTREIFGTYGMLMGTGVLLVAFIAFVWKQAVDAKRDSRFKRGVELLAGSGGGFDNNNSNLSSVGGYQQFDDVALRSSYKDYQYSAQPRPLPQQSSIHHVPSPPLPPTASGTIMADALSSTVSSSSVGHGGGGTGSNLSPSHGRTASPNSGDVATSSSFSQLPASLSSLSRQRQQQKLLEQQQEHHQIT